MACPNGGEPKAGVPEFVLLDTATAVGTIIGLEPNFQWIADNQWIAQKIGVKAEDFCANQPNFPNFTSLPDPDNLGSVLQAVRELVFGTMWPQYCQCKANETGLACWSFSGTDTRNTYPNEYPPHEWVACGSNPQFLPASNFVGGLEGSTPCFDGTPVNGPHYRLFDTVIEGFSGTRRPAPYVADGPGCADCGTPDTFPPEYPGTTTEPDWDADAGLPEGGVEPPPESDPPREEGDVDPNAGSCCGDLDWIEAGTFTEPCYLKYARKVCRAWIEVRAYPAWVGMQFRDGIFPAGFFGLGQVTKIYGSGFMAPESLIFSPQVVDFGCCGGEGIAVRFLPGTTVRIKIGLMREVEE